jgi:hypothetical protein
MRLYLLLFLVFPLTFSVSCQTDTNFIPLAAYWNAGDTYDFQVTKIKRTWLDKKLTVNDSSQYAAHFLVAGADSVSYIIEWSFKNDLFDKLQLPDESRQKLQKYDVIKVVYKTDQFGAFQEILNWKDLSNMLNEMVEELVDVKSRNHENADEVRKAFQPLISVYSSQRRLELLVFKELLMMHFPYGKQYEKGKIYNYSEEIPIMVNSSPATGDGIIFLRLANTDSQRCELVQRLKILPDSTRKFLARYFQTIGMNPQAIGSAVESSVVDVNDENIYDYYYYPGIPVKVSVSRSTRIDVLEDNVKQTDVTLIENIGLKSP